MKRYVRIVGIGSSLLILAALSACSSPSTPKTEPTATTTTTVSTRSTTALPSVGYIHNHAASVRSGAGLAYKAIGGVALGEQIAIVGKTGDWYKIRFGENETGFVSGQFVRFTPWVPTTTTRATKSTASRASTGASVTKSTTPSGSRTMTRAAAVTTR